MHPYEILAVLDPSIEGDEAIDAVLSRFVNIIVDGGGELENVDKWGKRRLAYEIDGNTEGYYAVINFRSESSVAAEVERIIKITDGVIRHLLVRRDA